ncbi:hypothetical protein VOLCADRAFT_92055 [Volvox carteri f. nagariensis]|uniref:BACK domain-containing protein n=1 Tax=Volvox carteri f. nagariensis TaxID=3068 RepID=D8TYZ9_VOLCA|nr:uncharacterized protein VOLCADRAFT_92055 [Volvox carteri f. nagariensis]EFJ47308.1 hypothetical protein VOLCADRAFT_92055 [Volvox carteri f. nagariensis]|eukprot:XP_002951497.1 hypothetical protein VOLCADRAFT_92055 [Volvox carteri f. nagariensis]
MPDIPKPQQYTQLERWCGTINSTQPIRRKRARCTTTENGAVGRISTAHLVLASPELLIPLGSAAEVSSTRAAIQFAYTGQVAAGSVREALEVRRQGGYLQIHGCAAACDELIKRLIKEVAEQARTLKYRNCMEAARTALPVFQLAVSRDGGRQGGGGSFVGSGNSPSGSDNSSVGGGGCNGRWSFHAPLGGVRELCECQELWPDDARAQASFADVLTCAGDCLASHFGSTLAVLNSPLLNKRLLSLPAIALELLLCSDDLATDCESSVLLLLATWMRENFHKTNDEDRERLCRTVRLAQLSRPYAGTILPALAADYELAMARNFDVGNDGNEDDQCGWFPIGVSEAAFIANIVSARDECEQALLMDLVEERAKDPKRRATYNPKQRPQCIPETGFIVQWHARQEDLLAALAELNCRDRNQTCAAVECVFDGQVAQAEAGGSGGGGDGAEYCFAAGIAYSVWIEVYAAGTQPQPLLEQQQQQQRFAGLYVQCDLPPAFAVPGSRLCEEAACRMVVRDTVELAVNRWQDGCRKDIRCRSQAGLMDLKHCWGWSNALPLNQHPTQQHPQQLQHQHQQQDTGGGGGGSNCSDPRVIDGDCAGSVDSLLGPWSNYLRDGKITGSLTLRLAKT